MKRKIAAIVFLGVFSLVTLGFRTQSTDVHFAGDSSITIIKGNAYHPDHDRYWDFVTFGVAGLVNNHYDIAFVNILNRKGGLIARVDDLDAFGVNRNIEWFCIDLYQYNMIDDFTLEIHVVQARHWDSSIYSRMMLGATSSSTPNDPEETILIVKYP